MGTEDLIDAWAEAEYHAAGFDGTKPAAPWWAMVAGAVLMALIGWAVSR